MTNEKEGKVGKRNVLSREGYLRQLAESGERLNICLTNDYAFHKIFKNLVVAKGFIMALLNLREDQIESLEIIDPIEEGESEEEKEGILDIKLHLNDGQRINIEMQNRYQEDWAERSLWYTCRMFAEGLKRGQPYSELEPCIHVSVLDFVQMKSPGFHHLIQPLDRETGELYSSKFNIHVIELKKLEEATEKERMEKMELYRWARLIAAKSWEEVCMEAEGNEYMEAAKEEMEKINQDRKERWIYLRKEMAKIDETSRRMSAQHEGERIGEARGEARGIKMGVKRGEEFFAQLTGKLIEQSRMEDLKKATENEAFRQELYKEFGIGEDSD